MQAPPIFLTPEEVSELSGVRSARDGLTKGERQSKALRLMGVPHYLNDAKLVIVVRAVLEGREAIAASQPKPKVRPPLPRLPGHQKG